MPMKFSSSFHMSTALIQASLDAGLPSAMDAVFKTLVTCLEGKHKILIAGNGGSASLAQHFATELVVRYKVNRQGLPVLALTADSTVLTAAANDFGYEQIFSKQIEALGQKGDVFIGLTTSGTSVNVLSAFRTAHQCGLMTVGLLGSKYPDFPIDFCLSVPSTDTPRIQEVHLLIIHTLCEAIEQYFSARI